MLSGGTIEKDGNCPTILKFVEEFDISRYKGKWYTQYRTANKPILNCAQMDVIKTSKGYYIRNLSEHPKKNTPIINRFKIVGLNDTGVFNVSAIVLSESNTRELQTWIVDTDYKNYALQFSCAHLLKQKSLHDGLIVTRQRHPPEDLLARITLTVNEVGLDLADFQRVNQAGCIHKRHAPLTAPLKDNLGRMKNEDIITTEKISRRPTRKLAVGK
ncbi:apolipoprotein D-like [Scaptodrosophila lebanonensis]|uniref:Apolipoprotein D-like n=1 Tax=Drosophila lebanonensis TaxID=7225 RepID=A0A6J2U8D8_DROLE|nr:apolipoprotein D-like [Scaptodrosophila lebanonensis]